MQWPNFFSKAQWRIATSITSIFLIVTFAASVQAALPDLPGPEVYPRAAPPIALKRGLSTIQFQPLRKVRTLSKRIALADRLIVVFQSKATETDKSASHLRAGARGAGLAMPLLKIGAKAVLVDVTGTKSLESAAQAYMDDPNVVAASPDWVMRAAETPNDPFFNRQGHLETNVKAPAAWNRTHGSTGVVVAILDTGINEAHSDLLGKVIARRDFTGSPSGTDDVKGHGTHVAGIAAASTNNSTGVAGMGYNSRLMNVKVLDDSGEGSISMLFNGIYWATDHGAHIINMSLASDDDCSTSWWEDWFDVGRNELRDSIGNAFSHNIVLVAAAGNSGTSAQHWPAACPNVLSIANTTLADTKASSSTFGTWVDVAAPGSSIFSTAVPGAASCQSGLTGEFANCSGTSMASPLVAGLAALVRASCNNASAPFIVARLTGTADPIAGTGTNWQFGRVNALRAVCFPPPSPARIGTVTASSIRLLWSDTTPGETFFEISRQPVGGSVTTVVVPANTTSFVDSGLTSGASIDYRVRTCDVNGCSEWSNTVRGRTGAPLTVTRLGLGNVKSLPAGINCGNGPTDCSEVYNPGTIVKLTPTGSINTHTNTEYEFDHWEGACAGQGEICTLTMSGAKSTRAVFVKTPFEIF